MLTYQKFAAEFEQAIVCDYSSEYILDCLEIDVKLKIKNKFKGLFKEIKRIYNELPCNPEGTTKDQEKDAFESPRAPDRCGIDKGGIETISTRSKRQSRRRHQACGPARVGQIRRIRNAGAPDRNARPEGPVPGAAVALCRGPADG